MESWRSLSGCVDIEHRLQIHLDGSDVWSTALCDCSDVVSAVQESLSTQCCGLRSQWMLSTGRLVADTIFAKIGQQARTAAFSC